MQEKLSGDLTEKTYADRIESVRRFERQLTDNGYLVMKFFLHISGKRAGKTDGSPGEKADTSWRISKRDVWQHKHYKKCQEAYLSFMKDTSLSSAPWYMIDAESRKWTELQVLEYLTQGSTLH